MSNLLNYALRVSNMAQLKEAVLVWFPVAVIKYTDKGNLKEKRVYLAHGFRVQSMITGMSRQQKLEAVKSRKQWINETMVVLNSHPYSMQSRILCLGTIRMGGSSHLS